ncbi:MAG TPA: hypothetical protein VGN86_17130 [Pyrinomonadaceae bacterium]|jgi:hypothetical protein|nr:hypothetical protein [Pyrinomonadaceae bacterium]
MNLPLETPTGRVDGCVSKETQGLFFELRDRFNDNMMREVILAACGLKVARTCMSDNDLLTFLPVAKRNNLQVVLSPEKYIHRRDIGKGGWSNSLEGTVPTDHEAGLFNVYIATDKYLADLGLKTEEDNYEDEFGLLLGIPECCRNAYLEGHELARLKQNDLVPIVLDNTIGPPPYNFWNNYVAQYFGRALLSFFPCSFNCAFAADLARMSFSVLQQCSRSWADRFISSQKTNILYTEYLGVHEFPGSCYMDGWMKYDRRLITSTENTQISQYLMSGNKLKVLGKHGVEIYNGDCVVKRLEDEDVSVCLFVGDGHLIALN